MVVIATKDFDFRGKSYKKGDKLKVSDSVYEMLSDKVKKKEK